MMMCKGCRHWVDRGVQYCGAPPTGEHHRWINQTRIPCGGRDCDGCEDFLPMDSPETSKTEPPSPMVRPLVYVAGPFTAPTANGIAANVLRAQRAGIALHRIGADPMVPHAMSRGVNDELTETEWLAMGLRRLRLCQAVLVLPGWRESRGTLGELQEAWAELGLPAFGVMVGGALPASLVSWVRSWCESLAKLPGMRDVAVQSTTEGADDVE